MQSAAVTTLVTVVGDMQNKKLGMHWRMNILNTLNPEPAANIPKRIVFLHATVLSSARAV